MKLKNRKIVLTGGPGAGKTTILDMLAREFPNRLIAVPEAATLLYKGGFPRGSDPTLIESVQTAIYQVQKNLERALINQDSHHVLLCDRATVDGAAYWPSGIPNFFEHFGTTLEEEVLQYDAVLFLESAATHHLHVTPNNPYRIEDESQSIELNSKIKQLWSSHPNFHLIPPQHSFLKKVAIAVESLRKLLD